MNTATQTAALAVRDLHAWYGESHVLQGVNFDVQHGEVVTLLGRNGAGRTTTLRALLGLTGRRRSCLQGPGPAQCPAGRPPPRPQAPAHRHW